MGGKFLKLPESKGMQSGGRKLGGKKGVRSDDDPLLDKQAEIRYNEIRQDDSDIEKISNNIGLEKSVVQCLKNHLFVTEHKFRDGVISRFDADKQILQVWERLIIGKEIKDSDQVFIMHERTEIELMQQGLVYEDAHEEANKFYNWQKLIEEEE